MNANYANNRKFTQTGNKYICENLRNLRSKNSFETSFSYFKLPLLNIAGGILASNWIFSIIIFVPLPSLSISL